MSISHEIWRSRLQSNSFSSNSTAAAPLTRKPRLGKPGETGIKRVIHAAGYSMLGLRAAWKHEAAFRQELSLAVLMTPLGIWLGSNAIEYALLLGSLLLVLIVELLNSAVEAVVDRVSSDHHALSGRAKDIGSAAVFISLGNVMLIWGLIGWEKFIGPLG